MLQLELRRWRRLGRRPRLWWRDDDARAPSPALDQLIDAAAGRPLTLAIIPVEDLSPLAARLALVDGLTMAQHGVDHINRRPAGQAPCEYDLDATANVVAQAIMAARARMVGQGLNPAVYVPPWNQVNEALLASLPQAGFEALSAGAACYAAPDLVQVAAQVDILRWRKGPARFRGSGRVLNTLRRQLRLGRERRLWETPVGLLTHHLDHDAAAWRFLAWFIAFADRHFQWCAFADAAGLRKAA